MRTYGAFAKSEVTVEKLVSVVGAVMLSRSKKMVPLAASIWIGSCR